MLLALLFLSVKKKKKAKKMEKRLVFRRARSADVFSARVVYVSARTNERKTESNDKRVRTKRHVFPVDLRDVRGARRYCTVARPAGRAGRVGDRGGGGGMLRRSCERRVSYILLFFFAPVR